MTTAHWCPTCGQPSTKQLRLELEVARLDRERRIRQDRADEYAARMGGAA